MTVRTIEEIWKLLRETTFVAKSDYEKYKSKLKEKYETEWVRSSANEEEKEIYDKLFKEACKWDLILKDFENHKF